MRANELLMRHNVQNYAWLILPSDVNHDVASLNVPEEGLCPHTLGPTLQDDLDKIDSYRFPGIQTYLYDLFPPAYEDFPDMETPVFVMAFSSSHMQEGIEKFERLNAVRSRYDIKLIFYDLGLTEEEWDKVTEICNCEVRAFPFYKFPYHIKSDLTNFAWKPIVIQIVLKQYRFVFWMDTSHEFQTDDLDQLFAQVKSEGVVADDRLTSIQSKLPVQTAKSTFDFLRESPCTFSVVAGVTSNDGHVSHTDAQHLYKLYNRNHNGCIDIGEFSNIFLDFDTWPNDNQISREEFQAGWRSDHLNNGADVPFYFEVVDHAPRDNVITDTEIKALYRNMFDNDGDGCVSSSRFTFVWSALFGRVTGDK